MAESEESKGRVVLQRIDDTISKINKDSSKLYFFVSDCKNIPNSNMLYVYNIARTLKQKGFDVTILYQLQNEYTEHELKKAKKKGKAIDELRTFVGVGEWLGESYSSIPHLNIANGTWTVSPSDFLFIPEVFTGLMKETFDKKVPCKRYVILQNFKYVTEFIPYGDQWASYGITDAIVSTKKQGELIQSVFPYVKTSVLNPFFPSNLTKPKKAKSLIVNIAASKHSDAEHIVKTFYWKYPVLSFVTFRSIRNFNANAYAEMLKEGCITIWHDPETSFGYSAVDAIKCGNIVIGKIPETIPEWMGDEETILDNGIWYNNIDDIPDILAKVVGSWMRDEIPDKLYQEMEKTAQKYTYQEWEERINDIMEEVFANRIKEINTIRETVATKVSEENKTGENNTEETV